jgi:Protein of unknown function (DUF2752)
MTLGPPDRARHPLGSDTAGARRELAVSPGSKLAVGLVASGTAPFLAAWVLGRSRRLSGAARSYRCPIRSAIGLPCPACGATRAFGAAVAGRRSWRRHNAPVVVYAVLLILTGTGLMLLPRSTRDETSRRSQRLISGLRGRPLATAILASSLALPPWIAALRGARRPLID